MLTRTGVRRIWLLRWPCCVWGELARQKVKVKPWSAKIVSTAVRLIGLIVWKRKGRTWAEIESKDARLLPGHCESGATTHTGGFRRKKIRFSFRTDPRKLFSVSTKTLLQGIRVSSFWNPGEGKAAGNHLKPSIWAESWGEETSYFWQTLLIKIPFHLHPPGRPLSTFLTRWRMVSPLLTVSLASKTKSFRRFHKADAVQLNDFHLKPGSQRKEQVLCEVCVWQPASGNASHHSVFDNIFSLNLLCDATGLRTLQTNPNVTTHLTRH